MRALRTDVLVVGAGPAGSALAAQLARAGRRVVLAEMHRHPRPKACAEYASPMVARELRLLGLPAASWQPDALALDGMQLRVADAELSIRYQRRGAPLPAWGLERERFDATLASHARVAGAELLEGVRLVELAWRNGRVTGGVLANGDDLLQVSATWVIGADGARSTVAHRVGAEREVLAPRRLGLVAHYSGSGALQDHGEMHVADGWYVGLAPLAGDRLNVGMALPLGGDRRPAGARFEAALDGIPAVRERLAGSTRIGRIRGMAPIGHRVARVAGPGWMLVGDAAGFIDPFTGEGIYRALRSARAAASALGPGDAGAGERYLAGRRHAFAAKDALTWAVQGMLAARPLMRHAVRRLAARQELALRLGSALGDCRPATDALSPAFLAAVLRP
jgi:geranylgeranyl reductase family protein